MGVCWQTMSAEEKPIEARKLVSWDWTAFWKEHQLLLNCVLSKCLPEIQTEYKLFCSDDLQDGYIIYDGKGKSVHVRHGLKKSIYTFCKKHDVPIKGSMSLEQQNILKGGESLNSEFISALYFFRAEEIQSEMQLWQNIFLSMEQITWSSSELDLLNIPSDQQSDLSSYKLLLIKLSLDRKTRPYDQTVLLKLEFLRSCSSLLEKNPSLLEEIWNGYRNGFLKQLRLQKEFLEKIYKSGTVFNQQLLESRDPEKWIQAGLWGRIINRMSIDILSTQSNDEEWNALQSILIEFVIRNKKVPTQKEAGDAFIKKYNDSKYQNNILKEIVEKLNLRRRGSDTNDQRSLHRQRFFERWGFSWLKREHDEKSE